METVTVTEEELTTMKYVNATTEFTVEEINSFFFYEVNLLVGLVSVMIDMIWRTTVTWSAGPIACKVVKYLQVTHLRRTQCWIEMSPWQWKLYISIVATTVFVVPAIVISGCYAIIVYTIWSKSKLLSPAKNNTLQRGTKKPEEHDIRRSSSRGIIPKAKIKTVKMTFVIVFGQYTHCLQIHLLLFVLHAYK
ncbi:PREDICTED: cardioacceleratory peptide receptor-like [Diuraphis noxia]|uniref:cardioacceleratory peptide receptor-like n=1 Tax=Diuraphis noxia TaxID=143948 RepID=UPI000763B906|nr:PREDICTED: cardioacceleratory peptide receptor-like [Diuraphis noxia]